VAAVRAGPVAERERRDHEIAALDVRDVGAGVLDDADELVGDRAGLERRVAAVVPEVRAADARERDTHDRVGRLDDDGVGPVAGLDAVGFNEESGRRSRPSRPACRPTVSGASRACAARRLPRWPASASSTTSAWNAATSAAPPSSCSKDSPGRSSSTTPNVPTSSTSPAPPIRSRRSGPGRSSTRSARSCSASSTRSPLRPPCATPAWITSAATRWVARCTRRFSRAASSPSTAPASRSSIPPPPTSTPTGDRPPGRASPSSATRRC
jgi:hypothetical protein